MPTESRVGAGSAANPVADGRGALSHLQREDLLRVLLCGSVDDGKSTLIGRLLSESRQRRFVVADTCGNAESMRNMVASAPSAGCAVILLDARQGPLTETRRHIYLVGLLGIRHAALAVNKMDLVGFSQERFLEIEAQCTEFAGRIGLHELTCIPVCALHGDNVMHHGEHMDWFGGATLTGYLETVEVADDAASAAFRMPVQWVNRASSEFRGVAGTIVSGRVSAGDKIVSLPPGLESTVERIISFDRDLGVAVSGQAVTLALSEGIDTSRGDVIASPVSPPEVADQFEATVIWMGEEPMLRGRSYLMRVGTKLVAATIAPLKYKVNVDSLEHVAANKLEINEIGVCDIELDRPIAFDSYKQNRDTGGFVLIDRITNSTVGAGMIHFALRRSHNVFMQPLTVDKSARAQQLHQTPCVLWLTGLSGAGKSTIANLVETKLHARGSHTYVLDGDNVRRGLNRDLGFTNADRVENIRRVAEVSKLMVDAGLLVLVSFISPFRSERQMARALFGEGEFLEVFVDTPLAVAEERDPKGLYKKARGGQLKNFTGIDSPYEAPERPDLRIDTTRQSPHESAARVLELLEARGVITPS